MMFFSAFVIAIFADMGMIQLLFPILSKIYLQKIATFLAMVGLLADTRLINNIKDSLRSRQGNIFVFLTFWIMLSVPFAVYPSGSLSFLMESHWKTVAVFLLILAYASDKDNLDKIIWTYILAVGFLGALTIATSVGDRLEIVGHGYDPNDTALQFIFVLPFAIWKFRSSKGLKKAIAVGICLILLAGIIATKSRGGFLGLVAVASVTTFQIMRLEKGGVVKALLLVLMLGGIMLYFGGDEYLNRISTITDTEQNYNYTSKTGRIEIWKRGVDMMLNHPLVGVGVICFISADGMLYADAGARWNAAHNSFVQIGAELGIPGLLAFCLLIGSSMRQANRIARNGPSNDRFTITTSCAIFGAWVGFVVNGAFLSAAYTSSFYVLLALSIAFVRVAGKPDTDIQKKTT